MDIVSNRSTARASLLLVSLLTLLLTGCPKASNDKQSKPASKCTSFGQRCEFLPGKLGSCVVRDGCQGTDCFVCQSQH